MEWDLKNPKQNILKVFIRDTFGGKSFLYVQYKWMGRPEPVDDYAFSSDSSAKRYYSTHYQSVKYGCEKPIWEKKIW